MQQEEELLDVIDATYWVTRRRIASGTAIRMCTSAGPQRTSPCCQLLLAISSSTRKSRILLEVDGSFGAFEV